MKELIIATLERALDTYRERFGESYVWDETEQLSDEEVIEAISARIKSGKKKPEPEYEDDCDY